MARRILTDEGWKEFEAALVEVKDPRGARWFDEARVIEAVLFLARTGTPCAICLRCGAVYMRFRRWQGSRVGRGLWEVLQPGATPAALQLFVDSTSIPVPPPAAGAPKNGVDQALGRSRGGLTTKLHAARVDEATALALILTEGQRHDSVFLAELYTHASDSGTVERVIANKVYDGTPIRTALAADGVKTTIPSLQNRRVKARWLPRFYRQRHKSRTTPKTLRFSPDGYDKLARCYLAFVHLVAATVHAPSFR